MESAFDIGKLMSTEGPIVKAVEIEVSGEAKELELDMTPKNDVVSLVLKGAGTFIGKYGEQGVVLLKVRDPTDDHKDFTGKLPYPFQAPEEAIKGSVLMIKMEEKDEDMHPCDFTLEDFHALAAVQKEKEEKGIVDWVDANEAEAQAEDGQVDAAEETNEVEEKMKVIQEEKEAEGEEMETSEKRDKKSEEETKAADETKGEDASEEKPAESNVEEAEPALGKRKADEVPTTAAEEPKKAKAA